MSNILIIAPHADDEILGCGGAISYYKSKGHKIYVAIMTNAHFGNSKRYDLLTIKKIRKEALRAHKFLKINKTFFYDFPAPNLDQHPISDISDTILNLLLKINPSKVFIPHIGDSHVDHQIIHKAALVATRPVNNFFNLEVFSYETLSETEWGSKSNLNIFNPNYFIFLKESNIKNKITAFNFYKSQHKKYPHPRSAVGIKTLSSYRGSNICQKNAEAFILLRSVKK